MKTKPTNSKRLDILGNGRKSDPEIFNSVLKRWSQKLGFCSVFAAVPAVLVSQLHLTRSAEASKKPEATVPVQGARLRERLNLTSSKRTLLRRQSNFVLPHQKGNFAMPAALTGNDDCPGRTIPGGNYTTGSPYIDSGDTTGSNNTFTRLYGYYYYYDASGPDHAYSFTLTGLGPNPQIEVSTTSGTYKPLAYVLRGDWVPCPAGTGNTAGHTWHINDSRWFGGTNTATLGLSGYPLNVPFVLFVDSQLNDASGSGPYTIKMKDVTIAPAAACTRTNPIDCVEAFVRQQYLDFLGREPDPIGYQNWINTLGNCPNGGFGEFDNPHCDRVHVSAGFYQSHEFQGRGYWLLRFSEVGLDRRPTYSEFTPDLQQIGGSKSPAEESAAKIVYTNAFVQRSEFQNRYAGFSSSQYVNALEQNAGVTLPNKQALIDALNAGTMTRADVLRNVVESQVVFDRFIIPGFVTMEYFGYLHRDPDNIGYQNWVDTLTGNPSDFRHMIFGFIYSIEYRQRFGQP